MGHSKGTTYGLSNNNTLSVSNVERPATVKCAGHTKAILAHCPAKSVRSVTNCCDVEWPGFYHGIRTKAGVDGRDHSQCWLIFGYEQAISAYH